MVAIACRSISRIYFSSLEDGTIAVLKSGASSPQVAENSPLGAKLGATPAIADDTLYVRTDSQLYAFYVRTDSQLYAFAE